MYRNVLRVGIWIIGLMVLLAALGGDIFAQPAPAFGPNGGETCQVFQPNGTAGKDAYIQEGTGGEEGDSSGNKGNDEKLMVKTENGKLNRALLQFDLSSLPSGATINSATLSLYIEKASGGSVTINAHQVTASWTEADVTWSDREAGTSWGTPGGDYSSTVIDSTVVDDSKDVWRSWDIKSLVADWVSGSASNYGVILEAGVTDPKATKEFTSSDGVAGQRPKLEVCYSSGAATGTPTSTPTVTPTSTPTATATSGGDPITVDGRLDDSYTFLQHFNKVDTGDPKTTLAPGNLYGFEGTNTCYWAFVVDRAFNDNVYADKNLDNSYLQQDGWIGNHEFKALERSDGGQFSISYSGGSYTLWLDYLNKEGHPGQYLSGTASGEQNDTFGSGWQSPIDRAATSLYWNLGNSGWSGGIWGDPLKHSPPFDYNQTSGNYWEWHMIYEFSVLKSAMGGACGTVTQSGAHNSPPKDDATKGKIGDYVWNDANQNGVQDDPSPNAPSAGIANVTVNLYDNNTNTLVRTTQTAPSGYYIFNNLDVGQYHVEFAKPTGYAFTTKDSPNAGGDDTIDSDADTSTGKTAVITLATGQTLLQWDAGLYLSNTDFGDLPETGLDNYAMTTLANDGARHEIGNLWLGATVDAEADGQPEAQAGRLSGGDDGDGTDDEDGVSPTAGHPWRPDTGGKVDVIVTGGNGCLSAWIDWNSDGSFGEAGDQILSNYSVSPGQQTISFSVPATATGLNRFARFRLYDDTDCTSAKSPMGPATNGEVEDYFWQFAPNAVTLTHLNARSSSGFPAGLAAAVLASLAGGVTIGGVLMLRRRER